MIKEEIVSKNGSNVTVSKKEVCFSRPNYEVAKDETGFDVKVYLPGVPKSASKIYVQEEILIVEGIRSRAESSKWRLLSTENSLENFRLRLRLNADVDVGRITASSRSGALIVRLPITEAVKMRKIKVE